MAAQHADVKPRTSARDAKAPLKRRSHLDLRAKIEPRFESGQPTLAIGIEQAQRGRKGSPSAASRRTARIPAQPDIEGVRVKATRAEPFHFVMIKPSHYDDDGYPIQWLRSAIPSNTLACLFALAEDARNRHVLGPEIDIRLHTYDETNRRVRPERIMRMIRKEGGKALIGLVGVQSNQFPRAVDLARRFLAGGLPVCIGGFHVSGCISMLPEMPPEMKEAQALGISFFAGEAEEKRLDQVLQDAWNGKLAQLYNHMKDLPALAGEPPPILPRKHVLRTAGSLSSIDLGRGCPYQCSFCTIINVQGRKSRFRSADDLEELVRRNVAQGINRFFITDDNFARNRDWEKLVDRLIALRGEGLNIGFTIQVDTLCHRIPNFIEKTTKAGVRRVFIGPTTCSRRRSARTRSPNIASCCRSGASTAPLPTPVTFLASPATPRNRSCAISKSSSGNCRSISSNSSSLRLCRAPRTTWFC